MYGLKRLWRQGSQASLLSRSSSSGQGSPPRLPDALRGPNPHLNPPSSPFWREAAPTLPPPLSAPWPSRPRPPNLAPRPGLHSAAASAPAAVFPLRTTRPLGGPGFGAEFAPRPGAGFGPLAEQGASGLTSAGSLLALLPNMPQHASLITTDEQMCHILCCAVAYACHTKHAPAYSQSIRYTSHWPATCVQTPRKKSIQCECMRLDQCLLPSAGDDDAPDPEALPPPSPRLLPGLRSMLAKTASAPLLGSAAARAREQVCISQRRSKYTHAVLLSLWGRAVDALGWTKGITQCEIWPSEDASSDAQHLHTRYRATWLL